MEIILGEVGRRWLGISVLHSLPLLLHFGGGHRFGKRQVCGQRTRYLEDIGLWSGENVIILLDKELSKRWGSRCGSGDGRNGDEEKGLGATVESSPACTDDNSVMFAGPDTTIQRVHT